MRRVFLLSSLLAALPALAQLADAAPDALPAHLLQPVPHKVLPPAEKVLAGLRARLPQKPIRMIADVQTYERGSRTTQLTADLGFDWRPPEPSARLRIFDRLGDLREEVTVRWPPDRPATFLHRTATADAFTPGFPSGTRIDGLALTWADLSMSFLWWEGGNTRTWETRRGRDCWVIDLQVPEASGLEGDTLTLWIDEAQYVLLRAELHQEDGALVTRIDADKLGKFGDLWMVKDLEIVHPLESLRTRVRVREVDVVPALGGARE